MPLHFRDASPEGAVIAKKKSESSLPSVPLLFNEQWWLSAATSGQFREVVVKTGDRVVGHIPFVIVRRMGFTTLRMPTFTHVINPIVADLTGKPQTQLQRRLSIVRDLIDQLPPFDFFKIALASPLADGLAFQDRGFEVSPQYTFEIDCRSDLSKLWDGMHFKTRQHIRRAEEKYRVSKVEDAAEFVRFYLANLRRQGKRSSIEFATFPALLAACRQRGCGEILRVAAQDGQTMAMAFLVWSETTMYYLLSSRASQAGDNGSVNLLIWSAIQRGHERGLMFDLDGVSSSGTARFLSGFGGDIKIRLIVKKTRTVFRAIQYGKRKFSILFDEDRSSFT